MTSRVEELQRMCDNINENGGLDSGEWHTALLAQIAQNLAVIADVMMADHKDEPQYDTDKGTIKCDNCSENGSYKCSKCDGEMYFKRLEVEDEPQTCSFGLHMDCSLCWKESHCRAIKEAERKEREGE